MFGFQREKNDQQNKLVIDYNSVGFLPTLFESETSGSFGIGQLDEDVQYLALKLQVRLFEQEIDQVVNIAARPQVGPFVGQYLQIGQHLALHAASRIVQIVEQQDELLRYFDQRLAGQQSERVEGDGDKVLRRITGQQFGAQAAHHGCRVGVVVHVLQNGNEFEFDVGGRGQTLDHLGDLVAHVDSEGSRLGGEFRRRVDGRFQFDGVVRVQTVADAVVDGLAVGYDDCYAAERSQR